MKNTKNNLVGQPIFKQLLDFIPRNKFDGLVIKHQSDRYYKTFDSWTQLSTMLFGILSRCDSMGEICDGMQGLAGKLNHFGLDKSPAKSTAGDGLRGRSNVFSKMFTLCCWSILNHFCRSAALTMSPLQCFSSSIAAPSACFRTL